MVTLVYKSHLFSNQPISDLGSETWRQMLVYAREFATLIFPDKDPPRLATGGTCVLCQQALDDEASVRMTAFDDYIVGRATQESTAAQQALTEHQNGILAFRVKNEREIDTMLAGYAALSEAGKERAKMISAFIEKARERLELVKGALQESRYDSLNSLDPLPDSPANLIDEEIARLGEEIDEIAGDKCGENGLAAFRSQHAELTDRKRLSQDIELVVEQRNRLEEIHRLTECRNQCRLRGITRRITDRRREILTPALKTALDDELKALRLTHIPLKLSDRGDSAESLVKVALTAQQRIANNSDVLSEGEQRALALACFLAELGEIDNNHGIIIDDPVSSLDHVRMQAVAKRLAEEAVRGRQVIVFTHNILFHYMVIAAARRVRVACHCEWMSGEGNDRFGLIDGAQKPWQMTPVSERLSQIGQEFRVLTGSGYDYTSQRFRPAVVGLYTKMRETWERLIEEVLFNGVVQRFRPEIMTQKLEEAYVDPTTDYPVIYEGMKRCSHYSGHDPAEGLSPELPDADHILQDIKDLKNFCDEVIERRKKLRKAPRYEKGVVPVLL